MNTKRRYLEARSIGTVLCILMWLSAAQAAPPEEAVALLDPESALFPETVNWTEISHLPVIDQNRLSKPILSRISADLGEQCPNNDMPAEFREADAIAPGDDDLVVIGHNNCAEGTWTYIWRHVHDPRQISYILMPFIIDRISRTVPRQFVANDNGEQGAFMPINYFISTNFNITNLPTNALASGGPNLVVPKSSVAISGSFSLKIDTVLLWAPQTINLNDPAVKESLGLFAGYNYTAPAGSKVNKIREYQDKNKIIWFLVSCDQVSSAGGGNLVGWMAQ